MTGYPYHPTVNKRLAGTTQSLEQIFDSPRWESTRPAATAAPTDPQASSEQPPRARATQEPTQLQSNETHMPQQTGDSQQQTDDQHLRHGSASRTPDDDGHPCSSVSGAPPTPGEEDEPDEQAVDLPLDQIFEILKNSRRRETLQYLCDNNGNGTLSDVAEHIAALENDTTVQAISSTQRKRVYVGLYQCHLPKMDDMGVIEFDKNRGTIELAPAAEQLFPYLEDDESQEWYLLYLGIAIAGALLYVFGRAGAGAYGLTPTVVLTGLILGITACGIAHSIIQE